MGELTLYLDKTTKAEFEKWFMNEYAAIKSTFKQKPVILIDLFEFVGKERLKVRIYHDPGLENLPPFLDLLKAIRKDWKETRLDILKYCVVLEKIGVNKADTISSEMLSGIFVSLDEINEWVQKHSSISLHKPEPAPIKFPDDVSAFFVEMGLMVNVKDYYADLLAPFGYKPAPTVDAGQPDNIISDNQGGTITYKRNEQGQTIIKGGTVNDGYSFEVGNKGVALKPFDASHFPANPRPVDMVETESKSPKDKAGAKTGKKKIGLPNSKAPLRKWALLWEFNDKHFELQKLNAKQFRLEFALYDSYDKPIWIPQDDETLQAILDYGRAGKIPKYDSIE